MFLLVRVNYDPESVTDRFYRDAMQGLIHIGSIGNYSHVVSENPIRDIWHHIELFTVEDFLDTCTPPVEKTLVPFLVESIVHAGEFLSAYNSSGEHTRALQQYYCFHNLTKAVLALENIPNPQYHGLKKVEVPSNNNLLDVTAMVDKGVLWDLLVLKKAKPVRDTKITFEQVLRRCVYMAAQYKLAYRKKSEVLMPKVTCDIRFGTLEVQIAIPDDDFLKNWKDLIPGMAAHFELQKVADNGLATFILKDDAPRGSSDAIQRVLGQFVTYNVFENPEFFILLHRNIDYDWPQEATMYALSFILSSLVRYYPDFWSRHVIGNKKNWWLVKGLMSMMERVYPNLMLNTMYGGQIIKFSAFSF
jgi:hypothetical protein